MTGNIGENQEQPSPISVLEPPFFEDDYTNLELSSYLKPGNQGNVVNTYARTEMAYTYLSLSVSHINL